VRARRPDEARKLSEEGRALAVSALVGQGASLSGKSDNQAECHDVPVKTEEKSKKRKKQKKKSGKRRCELGGSSGAVCRKKLKLTAFPCKCGGWFCAKHRYPSEHNCAFDFRAEAAKTLSRTVPGGGRADKIDRI
jgi:hypothetical protein